VLPADRVLPATHVRRDEEGFLYCIADAMKWIKSSGLQISPSEVEEVLMQAR